MLTYAFGKNGLKAIPFPHASTITQLRFDAWEKPKLIRWEITHPGDKDPLQVAVIPRAQGMTVEAKYQRRTLYSQDLPMSTIDGALRQASCTLSGWYGASGARVLRSGPLRANWVDDCTEKKSIFNDYLQEANKLFADVNQINAMAHKVYMRS